MTGKDLIIYILQNNLEDEPVFKDGKFLGFMSEEEAAVLYGVGVATVQVWVKCNMLPSIKLGNTIYIPADSRVNGASFVIDEQRTFGREELVK